MNNNNYYYYQEEGRGHFNCSTLEGVQLEDQGGSGTAGSHWEARITKVTTINHYHYYDHSASYNTGRRNEWSYCN